MTARVKPESVAKVTQVGNSIGIALPKDIVASLGVMKGDRVTFRRTPDGVEMVRYDAEYEDDMERVRDIMSRYQNTLRELAK